MLCHGQWRWSCHRKKGPSWAKIHACLQHPTPSSHAPRAPDQKHLASRRDLALAEKSQLHPDNSRVQSARQFGETKQVVPMNERRVQSGRFLSSVYEIDYRDMTRDTWRRARATFDQAYLEFRGHVLAAWAKMEDAQ
jgi:hypothetical protein